MLQLTGYTSILLAVLTIHLDAQFTVGPVPIEPVPVCPQSKCCSGNFPEGGSCEYTKNWKFWEKRQWCLDSGKTCPSNIVESLKSLKGSGPPENPCHCCKSCYQSWTCTQKNGVCVDPMAPNMDWSYWKFDICYSPDYAKCYARKGKKCYCCGWSKSSGVKPEQILNLSRLQNWLLHQRKNKILLEFYKQIGFYVNW